MKAPNKKVAILGGGVAGMSTAHELAKRGFEVDIYEWQPRYVGGKARSLDVPDSGTEGRPPLPGEHGFRFFPGFYRHITGVMKEIPIPGQRVRRRFGLGFRQKTVYDNLITTQSLWLARKGKKPIKVGLEFPTSPKKMVSQFKAAFEMSQMGFQEREIIRFVELLWKYTTSSRIRRDMVYERMSWLEFFEAEDKSDMYKNFLVGGIVRTLVAAKPDLMSAKTGGDILLQLLYLMANPGAPADQVLNGPTNDAWLTPWYEHLKSMGVRYHHGVEVKHIEVNTAEDHYNPQITRVLVQRDHWKENPPPEEAITADIYVSSVPVERMAHLIEKHNRKNEEGLLENDFVKGDELLAYIPQLAKSVSWMNGAQYYIDMDKELTDGHLVLPDSPWAITAISQLQFWKPYDLTKFGNGKAKGIISVDISDWFSPNTDMPRGQQKMASELSIEDILDQTWDQMESRLNGHLTKDMIVCSFLDRTIMAVAIDPCDEDSRMKLVDLETHEDLLDPVLLKYGNQRHRTRNREPLLVNTVNSWALRPQANTKYRNLYLASDYVRTNTDLATMEGANEAARRATNAILETYGIHAHRCKVYPLHKPKALAIWHFVDQQRYMRGLPWKATLPWFWYVVNAVWVPIAILGRAISSLRFPFRRYRA